MSNRSCFGGIDLANNHFIIPAVNSNGKVILHKSATRPNLLTT
ncbi:transposase (fragment) [Vibrio nigripulchritudo SFn118]